MSNLQGRAALITGASHGLGYAIAEAYLDAGASLMLCGRDPAALESARARLAERGRPGQRVYAQPADVANAADSKRLVTETLHLLPELCILVNNAGVYGPKGGIAEVPLDEWISAIEINLIGSVRMCAALVPHFVARKYGKIIQLSGGGATAPLPRLSAYAASKAGVVRFAETLAEELKEHHIDVNSVAPGALNTRLLDEILEAGPERVGEAFYKRAREQQERGGTPLTRGAELATFLASAASDGITGKLISAVWDPWEQLPERRAQLQGSDVYTLRRIVPKERGFDWGER
ncbi:MAG TPA: SDR family oxidoreductase [Polyangiales bacterium]|nr:SDR family oxidoreductase [Polyangiales bacterium]